MVKTQNIERTPIAKGNIGDKNYRVTKVTGEIQNEKTQEWYKYENIETTWVKVDSEGVEHYDLIKDSEGKTHKVIAEKTVTIPAQIVGAVFSVKQKKD